MPTRLVVLLFVLLSSLLPLPARAQTGNFKQIIMQDVTGAFTRFTRLTIAQRDASTHNTGEVIWCTDCDPVGLWVYDGTQWVPIGGGEGGGGTGDVLGTGAAPQVAFWVGPKTISGDQHLLWGATPPAPVTPVFDPPTKALMVGTVPQGDLRPGNAFMGLNAPSNSTGMQNLMLQTYQGDPGLAGLVTLGDDRVGISSWNFRGTGASNPIYGANFGVVFNTNGVANGLEIDVQNDSATNFQGQALWLNGSTRAVGPSGTVGHRANAILIDTQDGSKWDRGILFKEGFVGNGATGSIQTIGIHFERNQDSDFIAIQPRLGTSGNIAFKLTNPEFTVNRFTLLNSGAIRVGNTMTGAAFPSYAFVEDQTTGLYMEADAVLGFAIKREITCPITVPPTTPPCFAGDRRMTLGAAGDPPTGPGALNLWPWGTGANQGGGINLYDPSSVHSVGFLAADFISDSFRIKLPNVPGLPGQCVITSGPAGVLGAQIETWSYGACGTGTGTGGGTVTNSTVLNLNQLVLGGAGVDIKTLGIPGATNQVLHGNPSGPPTWGPVMIPDIGATGTPGPSTFLRGDGTWSTVAGAGTVTTSGSPAVGQAAFFTGPTVIAGDQKFRWDNTTKQFAVGLANAVSTSKVLTASGQSIGGSDPIVQVNAAFNGASPTVNHPVAMTLVGDLLGGTQMPVGFGVSLEFATHDYAGAGTFIANASIKSITQIVTPPTTSLVFSTQVAGVSTPLMSLDTGQMLVGRQVSSHVTNAINPLGGTFVASKSYAGGAYAVNDSLGALLYTAEGSVPIVSTTAAAIQANVDGLGGTRVKGRLSLQTSDGASLVERMRINADGVVSMGAASTSTGPPTVLTVAGVNTNDSAIVRLESLHANTSVSRTALALVHTTGGAQMGTGFGVRQDFILRDQDGVDNIGARFTVARSPDSDTLQIFDLQTASSDGLQSRMSVNGLGQVGFGPNPVLGIGTVAFYASGTARTHLTFFSNNNANNVQLVAPTATDGGNHVWKLPTTFGAVGSVLGNDGAGQLEWVAGGGGSGGGLTANMEFSNAAPNMTITESGTAPLGDSTRWRPAIRMILNDTTNSEKSGLYIESVSAAPTLTVTSLTRSGSTATAVTSVPHNFRTGDRIHIVGAVETEYNVCVNPFAGCPGITVTGATSFTYPILGSPVTVATGSIAAEQSRVTSGMIIAHASSRDNGNDSSALTTVSWRDGNAATFQRFCHPEGRPVGMTPCVMGRNASFAIEVNGTGNMTNVISGGIDSPSTVASVISYAAGITSPPVGSTFWPSGFVAFLGTDELNLDKREAFRVMKTGLDNLLPPNPSQVSFIVTMDGATRVGPSLTGQGEGSVNTSKGYYTNDAAPVFPSLAGAGTVPVTVDSSGRVARGGASSISGSGAVGQVTLWSGPNTLTGTNSLTSDGTNLILGTPTVTGRALNVNINASPLARLESSGGSASGARTALELVRTAPSGQPMSGAFAVRQDFILRDNAGVDNINARIVVGMGTVGSTGTFAIQTAIGGAAPADRFAINELGQAFYIPTPTSGTFGLRANGTRNTELQFYTDNNANAVAFVAPPTATGNHVWRLPTTFGNPNSILGNDGFGNLFWGDVPNPAIFLGLQVGESAPFGGQAAGPLKVTVSNSDNANPYQTILGQMVNGSTAGVIPVSIGNDKAAVSGWAFRGVGGSSPIYGGHFGAKFDTPGVSIGVEIGVQNYTGINPVGNGLWVNGSGPNHRDNAVLIDTQDGSKWNTGIRFTEGNTAAGATGSIAQFGIVFDKSHDADFLVIRPRVDVGNAAIRITNSTFTTNQFIITNDGNMALGGAAIFGGSGSINTNGNINTVGNVGANQYFSNASPGFGTPGTGTVKVAGACTFTIAGGIITNVTGC